MGDTARVMRKVIESPHGFKFYKIKSLVYDVLVEKYQYICESEERGSVSGLFCYNESTGDYGLLLTLYFGYKKFYFDERQYDIASGIYLIIDNDELHPYLYILIQDLDIYDNVLGTTIPIDLKNIKVFERENKFCIDRYCIITINSLMKELLTTVKEFEVA